MTASATTIAKRVKKVYHTTQNTYKPRVETVPQTIWNDVRDEILTELWKVKWSPGRIAEILGVTPPDVRSRAIKLGLIEASKSATRTHTATDTEWSREKKEQLVELWGAGYSGREIADMIGGVSRSAVIGKANRLGLPKREPRKVRKRVSKRPASSATITVPVNASNTSFRRGGGIPLLRLEARHCRWPLWPHEGPFDPATSTFCGAPVTTRAGQGGRQKKSSYCKVHEHVAHHGSADASPPESEWSAPARPGRLTMASVQNDPLTAS